MSLISIRTFTIFLGFLLLLLVSACQGFTEVTASPTPVSATTPTLVPLPPTPDTVTCGDIDINWGSDWPATLEAIEELIAADQSCGEEPLLSKKYAAHFIYGMSLEEEEELEPAIAQYRAAMTIDPQRQEALNALIRLDKLPKPTPPTCLSNVASQPDPAPDAEPDDAEFVTVQDDQLQLDGEPFQVRGVNYYPRRATWQRFLTEADPAEMAEELDVIKEAGLNTLRIFLWYEPLFTCQPEDAIPNEDTFATLDTLLQLAAERDLKVIMTLNDLPDLVFRPLYTDYAHYDNQTRYIVRRYRNEPAILAWDVRNEGDHDYILDPEDKAPAFTEAEVVDWVAHISQLIHEHAPYHLLTASWADDPLPIEPYVDFVSFYHADDINQLQVRINKYRRATSKPLLLQGIGFSSWLPPGEEADEKQSQSATLSHTLRIVEAQGMAGWMIWTAFDFVPAPGQLANEEHFYGLWTTDLTPKPVLDALSSP